MEASPTNWNWKKNFKQKEIESGKRPMKYEQQKKRQHHNLMRTNEKTETFMVFYHKTISYHVIFELFQFL